MPRVHITTKVLVTLAAPRCDGPSFHSDPANDEDKQRIVCRAQMRLEKRRSDIGAPCEVAADHTDKLKENTEFDDFIYLRDSRSDRRQASGVTRRGLQLKQAARRDMFDFVFFSSACHEEVRRVWY